MGEAWGHGTVTVDGQADKCWLGSCSTVNTVGYAAWPVPTASCRVRRPGKQTRVGISAGTLPCLAYSGTVPEASGVVCFGGGREHTIRGKLEAAGSRDGRVGQVS